MTKHVGFTGTGSGMSDMSPNFGFLVEKSFGDEIKPVVYLMGMYEAYQHNLKEIPTKEFQDWDSLLDDGWRVD